ncbi:LOW QUALITY PROTEIN: transmembrane protein 212 [Anser cygnoides]|uniref:LOW QUALITY PROTEIN: transmembrane protein 212 n=1 Tax=Anser cygnoides TaxID=8845 RepID=UPI0034D1C2F6
MPWLQSLRSFCLLGNVLALASATNPCCESGRQRLTMTVKSLYEVTRGILTTFGIISIFSGIFAFFPVFSYKSSFVGWSVCLASPIWKGALVGRTKALSKMSVMLQRLKKISCLNYLFLSSCKLFLKRSSQNYLKLKREAPGGSSNSKPQLAVAMLYTEKHATWEAGFALGTLSTTGASVQFAVAIPSLLLGPYCYYSLTGITGTNYLGDAVPVPFPYTDFPNFCIDPARSKWYHLALQVLDLCSSPATFCASSAVVIKLTMRLLQLGCLNVSMSCDGEGGLSP